MVVEKLLFSSEVVGSFTLEKTSTNNIESSVVYKGFKSIKRPKPFFQVTLCLQMALCSVIQHILLRQQHLNHFTLVQRS